MVSTLFTITKLTWPFSKYISMCTTIRENSVGKIEEKASNCQTRISKWVINHNYLRWVLILSILRTYFSVFDFSTTGYRNSQWLNASVFLHHITSVIGSFALLLLEQLRGIIKRLSFCDSPLLPILFRIDGIFLKSSGGKILSTYAFRIFLLNRH